jgi:phosphate acyltransferase
MKKKEIKVAIDLMGNDIPPIDLLKACIAEEKKTHPHVSFVFIGTKELQVIAKKDKDQFLLAENVIYLNENPLAALRKKKESSIAVGIGLLKEDKVDALVSAGNTGALMSSAKMNLSMLPLIGRPSLLALLPTEHKTISVIDVGANISSQSKYLVENAMIGIAFQKAIGNPNPILALLNIGSEAQKGTSELKKAFEKLKKISSETGLFKFVGNIEPKEVFQSEIDVLVTDGFTGNIFLKTAEGIANFILHRLMECNDKCESINPYFSDLKKYLYSEQYPGALLCGVDKIIIKCHSYSSIHSFISAINGSIGFIENKIVKSISKNLDLFASKIDQ